MAGDISVREQVVILPEQGSGAESVVARIAGTPGRVLHQYGERVLVVEAPPGAEFSISEVVPQGALAADASALAPQGLTETESLGLEAIKLRQSDGYTTAKQARPHQGEDWDSGAADAPGCLVEDAAEAGAAGLADADAPTSTRLTGTVAVGVIIVQGPTDALKFSAAESTKVVAEVQNGLGWLGAQNPAGAIGWKYEIRNVTITAKPGPDSWSRAQKEDRFRDPAMAKLGYGAGLSNVTKYVNDLRTKLKTTWAYCVFFTKYPVGHFAYAGRPRVIMHYDNDGWGPDNIDRVFAHETGHIFGAPDEYASSGCNCGGSHGYYGKPNANCASCAPGGGVKCLMKGNDWEMCAHTPYHLGFPLVQQRFSGVWRGGSGKYGLWVNASWSSFQSKWNSWSKSGLRLVDMKITPSGSSRRYHGCFIQGSGKYGLWVNSDWNSFHQKWQEWAGQGMRLIDIDIIKIGNAWRYSGVWTSGTDKYGLWVNATWASFQQKWQEWAAQGLRLVDLKIIDLGPSGRRYTGVWRGGNDKYGLWVNSDWNAFRAKWEEWAKQGLRLVDLEIVTINGQRRYSGVWRGGSDKYGLWVNSNFQDFHQKWEEWAGQGMRLIDLEVTDPTGVSMAAEAGAQGVEIDENGGIGFGGEMPDEFGDLGDDLDVGMLSGDSELDFSQDGSTHVGEQGGVGGEADASSSDSADGMGGIDGAVEDVSGPLGEGGLGGDPGLPDSNHASDEAQGGVYT